MKNFINNFKRLDTKGKLQWLGIYISIFGMILHGIFGLVNPSIFVTSMGLTVMISSLFVN